MTIQEAAQAKVGDTIRRVVEVIETVESVRTVGKDGSLLVTIETETKERVVRTLGGKTETRMMGARITREQVRVKGV